MRILRLILLVTALCACAWAAEPAKPGPAPRHDGWEVLGMGGGGTMLGPTFSPHDPNIILLHCDMTGAYLTTDGGQSWRMFNLRSGVSSFAFDPRDRNVIYAGNMGLWRSQDLGQTWSLIWPDPKKNTREHMNGDHAEYSLTTDDPSYPGNGREDFKIAAIAVGPCEPDRVYLAVEGSKTGALVMRSEGGGQTFSVYKELGSCSIRAMAFYAFSDLYIVTDQGSWLRQNDKWDALRPSVSGSIKSATVAGFHLPDADHPDRTGVYVTTTTSWDGPKLAGGIYRSDVGAEAWEPANGNFLAGFYKPGEGLPPVLGPIACGSDQPSHAYVSFTNYRMGSERSDRYNGIARTTDGGKTWTIVHKESNRPDPNMECSWYEGRAVEDTGDCWFDAPRGLAVAPTNPDICMATDCFRAYRTSDGGKSWQQVTSVKVGENRWTTRGLDVTTNYGVQFDPFDSKHLFIDQTDMGLFQSGDGGKSWMISSTGIPLEWKNTLYWLAFDPSVKGLMWGAASRVHDLPRPKMFRHSDPEKFQGGVVVSTDGGMHWQASGTGMPLTAVTHILLDPKSPEGKRTLYACSFGRGVYKSTDNGNTWTLKNQGLEQTQPFAWRITRAEDGTLYLVVARRSEQGRIGDGDDGALYRSTDGAEHWTRLPMPEGTNGPTGLTLDPSDPKRFYLSAWGRYDAKGDQGGGAFVSTDSGQTWKNMFNLGQHVYDVTVDAEHPRELFLCGFDSAAWHSSDAGATWNRIKGYNFKWGHRVILDPVNRGQIYITTFGGGVWHGPIQAIDGCIEDVRDGL